MPSAIEYGMPLDEFWHGDMRLLGAYEKAYYRRTSYAAWENGKYVWEAITKAIYNGFGRGKTDKPETYSQWVDPIKKEKPVITKDNLEEEFRKQQVELNAWLFHR